MSFTNYQNKSKDYDRQPLCIEICDNCEKSFDYLAYESVVDGTEGQLFCTLRCANQHELNMEAENGYEPGMEVSYG